MLSIVSGKKTWDRHIVFRAAVWTLVLRGKKSWNRREKCLCLRLVFLRESTEGRDAGVDKKELVEMQASRKR